MKPQSKPYRFLWFSRVVRYFLTKNPTSRFWNQIFLFFKLLWQLLKRRRLDEQDCLKPRLTSHGNVDDRTIFNSCGSIYASAMPPYDSVDMSTFPVGQDGSSPSTSSRPPQPPMSSDSMNVGNMLRSSQFVDATMFQELTPGITDENDTNPEHSMRLGDCSQIPSIKLKRTSFSQAGPTDTMLNDTRSAVPIPANRDQSTSSLYAKLLIEPIAASSFKRYERNIILYAL